MVGSNQEMGEVDDHFIRGLDDGVIAHRGNRAALPHEDELVTKGGRLSETRREHFPPFHLALLPKLPPQSSVSGVKAGIVGLPDPLDREARQAQRRGSHISGSEIGLVREGRQRHRHIRRRLPSRFKPPDGSRPAAWQAVITLIHCADERAPVPVLSASVRIFGPALALEIAFVAPGLEQPGHTVFVAIGSRAVPGSAKIPFAQGEEGSAIFLPFRAERFYSIRIEESAPVISLRVWTKTKWSERRRINAWPSAHVQSGVVRLTFPPEAFSAAPPSSLQVAVWAKEMFVNDSWGACLPDPDLGIHRGINDRYLDRYFSVELVRKSVGIATRRGAGADRVRIYQLLPRLFGNINETRKPNGTIQENGVGKFADLNEKALRALRGMGFTHLWLTGILAQASASDYRACGLPADDPDLLKGLAGSPYAIKDLFDLCPDYALDPANRRAEFVALLERIHAHGLRALIDFAPNHVARSHRSTIRPDLEFGARDDRGQFFAPQNNFFWLQRDSPGGGPPLRLPTVSDSGEWLSSTCLALAAGDGLFADELAAGRVAGNNAASWRPSMNDWYETAKLNYGFDFTTGTRAYPNEDQPDAPIPDTWQKMDAVLAHWQGLGVDGFRCDMAHMVPPEFWAWAVHRARQRHPATFFVGEAYDNDPMKVGADSVMVDLLSAGFDAVYDDPAYKTLKGIYEGDCWANDLDAVLGAADREYVFQNALRYAENHDEVRLAGRNQWGRLGPQVGRPVSAILFGLSRGPLLLYSGQEVGEPADGAEGFGSDDARTTIFDYWSMPELVKWVNGHRYDGGRLSVEQQRLREFYARLVQLVAEPAFGDGDFFGLNGANRDNPHFGRLPGETTSGHWLYAFLRSDPARDQRFLVVVNLHPSAIFESVRIAVPPEAIRFIRVEGQRGVRFVERLSSSEPLVFEAAALAAGVVVAEIPPLTPFYFELQIATR